MVVRVLDGTIGTPTKILIASERIYLITSGSLLELMIIVLEVSLEHVHLPLFH